MCNPIYYTKTAAGTTLELSLLLLLSYTLLLLNYIQKSQIEQLKLELVEIKVVARFQLKPAIYGTSILSSLEHLNEEQKHC